MIDATIPEAYAELQVDVPRTLADAVCNFIIENICSGLILEEEEDSSETRIKFYVPGDQTGKHRHELSSYLSSLTEMESGLSTIPEIRQRVVKAVQWEEEYRRSVEPLLIAGDIAIRPPWRDKPDQARYDIVIEPRMAFGTGSHESTRGSLAAIREHFRPGMRFLDMGCGSGVLSILAERMGAEYIKAVDNDILAVENCGENFLINTIEAPHDIIHGSIESCRGDAPYDFICANIIKSTILDMLDELDALTASSGYLVLSGLLDQDEQEVAGRLKSRGLDRFTVDADNEWRTFTVRKR